jgi:hypothetical protein
MAGTIGNKETKNKDKGGSISKPAAKAAASSRISKGDQYLCEICALSLHVDECGEFLKSKGPVCCGRAMKKKAGSAPK